jgi:hypothetical protein
MKIRKCFYTASSTAENESRINMQQISESKEKVKGVLNTYIYIK